MAFFMKLSSKVGVLGLLLLGGLRWCHSMANGFLAMAHLGFPGLWKGKGQKYSCRSLGRFWPTFGDVDLRLKLWWNFVSILGPIMETKSTLIWFIFGSVCSFTDTVKFSEWQVDVPLNFRCYPLHLDSLISQNTRFSNVFQFFTALFRGQLLV